jgi:hypothetical protein
MTTERQNPFDVGDLIESPASAPNPEKPTAVDRLAVDRVARETGFVSRQPARGPRYRTGRNRQLNLKVREDALQRFYALADAMNEPLGAVFEEAVGALEDRRRRIK